MGELFNTFLGNYSGSLELIPKTNMVTDLYNKVLPGALMRSDVKVQRKGLYVCVWAKEWLSKRMVNAPPSGPHLILSGHNFHGKSMHQCSLA